MYYILQLCFFLLACALYTVHILCMYVYVYHTHVYIGHFLGVHTYVHIYFQGSNWKLENKFLSTILRNHYKSQAIVLTFPKSINIISEWHITKQDM